MAYKQQKLFPTVPESGKSKIKASVNLVSGEGTLPGAFSLSPHRGLFYKVANLTPEVSTLMI